MEHCKPYSQAEWESELDLALDELTQQDGRAILSMPDPAAHNYTSWCKLFAVYGESFTQSRVRSAGFRV